MPIDPDKHYRASENVIAREIEGELILVPLKSGIGNLDSEMYALNRTGSALWNLLDGRRETEEIIRLLCEQFKGSQDQIRSDILELIDILVQKGMVTVS